MDAPGLPKAQGLYDPSHEHDSCGVGFLVHLKGQRSHQIVRDGLQALENLNHRGACGCEINTGDGAGLLIQIPDEFFRHECAQLSIRLPESGEYGVGFFFAPSDDTARARAIAEFTSIVAEEGQLLLGWRDVPTNADAADVGPSARAVEPRMMQAFIGRGAGLADDDAFERRLYVIRKRFEKAMERSDIPGAEYCYFPSLSSRTIVYKGMLTAPQLSAYFDDLADPRVVSALAMFHSRFSTNTFPSWKLAHPYRFISHNGEINTLRGNVNWMTAREALMASPLFDDINKIIPVIDEKGSDTAILDNAVELLVQAGWPLPQAMMMLIPEAWSGHTSMPAEKAALYEYQATVMEPWDGPACVAFTDGKSIGAVLDRNGLRPSRYVVTKDDLVLMASEVGTLPFEPERILRKGRLQPGKMFLVDLEAGRIIDDTELKMELATKQPYQQWLDEHVHPLETLPTAEDVTPRFGDAALHTQQMAFGYTVEDLKFIIAPMMNNGEEAIGSMGSDTPVAVLSQRAQPLYNYFQQLFAQVTNPPLDAIREELVTSVYTNVGPEGNLLDQALADIHVVKLENPFLDNAQMAAIRALSSDSRFRTAVLSTLFDAAAGPAALEDAMTDLFRRVDEAVASGSKIIVLSDRGVDATHAPIPTLLAIAGVHNHLVREKKRTQVGVVIESGEPREVHHFALLIGYGASAVNPYLALDSLPRIQDDGYAVAGLEATEADEHYLKAIKKGVVKIMSKMGISTVHSYRGAQIFEAIGLAPEFIDHYFTKTVSRIGGVGIDTIAQETLYHHERAFPKRDGGVDELDWGGQYQWRRDGEYHLFNPETVFKLQHATRTGRAEIFREYTAMVNQQAHEVATLRGLFELKPAGAPIPIEEVESAESLFKRFKTGAMSYGSISSEAHETLAIAMNRLGGKSNTGEGGEDRRRYTPDANGDSRRSAIKQVASGRFGVTSEYLVNADEIQIKMAQGAKPGEGGQLPGSKVYPWIAEVRHATPGVGLISPPPHHDIYSIEDLAQLIHDLKNANRDARISVKLVAEVGVGTVAAGVAKAKSDVVLISGHDGGTGASPLNSLKHAGTPWELGLAETQQTLVLNRLRDRIRVEVDGQLKTGRDVIIGALLGAEEFGFATAPLVVMGCVMMRVCHLDTCPVGIATQNPQLRERFAGQAEHVENFFRFIAEEVREYMAQLGFRKLEDMVGRSDLLDMRHAVDHWKAQGLDLSAILYRPEMDADVATHNVTTQDHGLEAALDFQLLPLAQPAIDRGEHVRIVSPIRNVNRTVGTIIGSEVTKRYANIGLPDDTIEIHFNGSAGQSFGAFVPSGMTLRVEGDTNDYVGKGLSGGKIIVLPSAQSTFVPEENIIVGNVALYGATSGSAFFRGIAGERFAVRNSGAVTVVEGTGDHACEYMTGGRVVIIGETGRNFGAGMSGGVAYVLDADGTFESRCNMEMIGLEALDEPEDLDLVRGLLERHHEYTGSTVAAGLLADWPNAATRFKKVMPREYRRVLDERRQEAARAAVAAGGMAKPTGFLEFGRETPQRRPVSERVHDWLEVYESFPTEALNHQAARCMDCGIPFCHQGCPLGNIIPDWNDLVYRNRWQEAIERLHATNNFPEFTGRLCPAPCEAACVLGINQDPVTIKQVELTIIEHAYREGWIAPEPPAVRTGKTVAVIGSGPAGLAAAQQLARAGHAVTVFERDDRIGGLMRYGIPDFKMQKEFIDRRLTQMEAEGVTFRPSSNIGKDIDANELRSQFDAVLLAGGSTQARDLTVPGRELRGVYLAMEYLPQQNKRNAGDHMPDSEFVSAEGKRVIILGGGDTGADCLGTAIRQGASEILQYELLPRPADSRPNENPWPTYPNIYRVSAAHEEGGLRDYSILTKSLSGDAHGNLTTLHAVRVEFVTEDGRSVMREVPGSEFEVECDLLLLAMGFVGPERGGLLEQLGVELTDRGNVKTDASRATSVPGVYAAGDMARGQSLIVWAIAEGRTAARGIDEYLMSESALPSPL